MQKNGKRLHDYGRKAVGSREVYMGLIKSYENVDKIRKGRRLKKKGKPTAAHLMPQHP